LERRLEGRDQPLKLVKRHAREIQELHRTGLQLGEPYTCHGSCLLSLYGDERGTSYQKESGINSAVGSQLHTLVGRQGTGLIAAASTAGIGTSYWSPRRKPLMT